MFALLVGVALAGLFVEHVAGESQDATIAAARIDSGHVVVSVFDSIANSWRPVYRSEMSSTTGLSLSADGRYIALIETTEGRVVDGEYAVLPKNRLIILDPSGNLIHMIDRDVRRYVFCCGSSSVAFIEGPYREGGAGYRSTGTFLRNFITGEETEIRLPQLAEDRYLGIYDLNFAAFDGALYLKTRCPVAGSTIFRFVPGSEAPEPSQYNGFHFSPSGRFYVAFGWPGGANFGPRIFDRQSGVQVGLPDETLGNLRATNALEGGPAIWAFGSGDLLMLERSRLVRFDNGEPTVGRQIVRARRVTDGYTVYSLPDRRVVMRIDGRMERNVAARRGVLPIFHTGGLRLIDKL